MKLSIIEDSRFVTDGKGNYYSSSNIRRPYLYSVAEHVDKLILVMRVFEGDMSDVPQQDIVNHPKIEFVHVPSFRGPPGCYLKAHRIRPILRGAVEQSDVCDFRFASAISGLGVPIAKALGTPTIGHVMGEFGVELRANKKHIPIPLVRGLYASAYSHAQKKSFQACDALAGTSKAIARLYAQPGREVYRLSTSSLTEEFFRPVRPYDGHPDITCIFAGRLVEFKNVQGFLRAMKKLVNHGIRLKVIILGDGAYRPDLEKLTGELQLTEHVEFTGRIESREEVWRQYERADIGFMLSWSEGLPLGGIEPMSAGLPLLGARMPYMTEILDDGVQGYMVDPHNTDEIADKLEAMATDHEKRIHMAHAALERAREFSADQQARNLVELAEQLMANPTRR
jgi:glycosyltransferase involved in cell wall biosynthesis